MFTGIVQGTADVVEVTHLDAFCRLGLRLPEGADNGLQVGASIAVDGVCLTIVRFEGRQVWFDVIDETLRLTTLGDRAAGDTVNIERAACFGDEIGGHNLSGHITGAGVVVRREDSAHNCALWIELPVALRKYVLHKGYVGVDGASLTVGEVDEAKGTFSIHLIPETLRLTGLDSKGPGARVNIEVDAMTQAVVDTVARVLAARGTVG